MKDRLPNRERTESRVNKTTFVVTRPGGNDTALVDGIPSTKVNRKKINDGLMSVYPNVEQVGFVNLDPRNPELMMAGGEFCGNATRATAWSVLNGNPGEIAIKVSGVEKRLKAGVTHDGESFAQMPVYEDVDRIRPDSQSPNNYIVTMEGITHYVDFDPEQIDGLNEDGLKAKTMLVIKAKGLDEVPAAGVIYTKKVDEGYEITPVVYVKDIDTLFVETACGSGTAALGLVTAVQTGESVKDLSVLQPSGLPIKVSVDYNDGKIGYTQIKGPVEKLNEGVLEIDKEKYAIEQIKTNKELDAALKNRGLRDAYKDAFGRPPYNESYEDDEIDEMFGDYVRDGHVFVAISEGQIIAFSATQPLKSVPEMGEMLVGAPGIVDSSWYIPDLGIRKKYEGNGIAKNLMNAAIQHVPEGETITLRTSVANERSQGLYLSLGFDYVQGVYEEKSHSRIGGEEEVDRRLFMSLERKAA